MAVCEKCWSDAYFRALTNGKSQAENYHDLIEERKNNPCPQDGAILSKLEEDKTAPSNAEPMKLSLYNHADGVDGHYCVGRLQENGVYHEYWTGNGFSGFGRLYESKQAAEETINALTYATQQKAQARNEADKAILLIETCEMTFGKINEIFKCLKENSDSSALVDLVEAIDIDIPLIQAKIKDELSKLKKDS